MSRMKLGLIAVAVVVAALAAASLGTPASASTVTEDDSLFTWSNGGADVAVTLGVKGNAPTSGSLPTATYDGGQVVDVTYQLIGSGVTLNTETLTKTMADSTVSYTSSYYTLPNGVTYNKGAGGLLENSSSTTGPSTATYQWRAVSFDSKYSEVDLNLSFVLPISFEQTTSNFDLRIGNSDTLVMDAPVSVAGGPYTYRLMQHHFYATLWKLTNANKCQEAPRSLWQKCLRMGYTEDEILEGRFNENAYITFNSSTLTIQLKSWLFDNPDYRASGIKEGYREYGSYDFTVMVTDSAGEVAQAFMTVNMLPATLHYETSDAVTATASRSENLDVTVPMPGGGVSQLFISTSNKPSWWNISHDGFENSARIHVRDRSCEQFTGTTLYAPCLVERENYVGTHTVTFTVTDSSPTKQTASTTVTVTITE